jgi:hypothetical protein
VSEDVLDAFLRAEASLDALLGLLGHAGSPRADLFARGARLLLEAAWLQYKETHGADPGPRGGEEPPF